MVLLKRIPYCYPVTHAYIRSDDAAVMHCITFSDDIYGLLKVLNCKWVFFVYSHLHKKEPT